LKIKKGWVTVLKEQKFVKENKESSKLFYYAARVQQVKLKGKMQHIGNIIKNHEELSGNKLGT
jgi:hypothetical protein